MTAACCRLDGLHKMYWEQSGNPKGKPVVFLHGGPGAGADADPSPLLRSAALSHRHFRSARRRPLDAAGRDRRQHHAASDRAIIERLRQHLGIERWPVFGGSWGSTLALAYAEAHPERVAALALRGIFLCRQAEIDWFLYGMRELAPEAWREFRGLYPGSRARRSARRLLHAA